MSIHSNKAFSPGTGVAGTMGNVLGGGVGGSSSSDPTPPPTPGTITPLSRLLVVDPNASGTLDGAFSGAQAYATLATAIAAATDQTTILMMPGDYSGEGGEGGLSWDSKSLGFWCLGERDAALLPPLTATTAGSITAYGCKVQNLTAPDLVELRTCTLDGVVTAAEISLRDTLATNAAELDGDVTTDLLSFNAFGAAEGTLTGDVVDIVDTAFNQFEVWCNVNGYAGGNGTEQAPYPTLREAIEAAPDRDVGAVTIHLAPGGYFDGDPIPYTDKRLSIQGTQLLNESPDPPTFGVHLQPTSTGDVPMALELIRTNSNVSPQSQGLIVLMQDGHCECISDGTHFASWSLCGTSPQPMVLGTEGTTQSTFDGYNYHCNGATLNGSMTMFNGRISAGGVTLLNLGTTSTIQGSKIEASVSCSGVLNFYDNTFPAGGAGVVISGGNVTTDLATYARGVDAGVTWPETVRIVDTNVQLQPFRVNSGAGSNSLGNPTPGYGANIAGDLFVCRVNSVGGTAPTLPAGWTLDPALTVSGGGVISQVWTRDARSAGAEVGTIIVTAGGGNPTQAIIDTYRNVATTNFVESKTAATTAGAGPTTLAGATVTAAGKGRLAVMSSFSNGTVPPDQTSVAGETGGTWQIPAASQLDSGLGGVVALQTAALADSATITGGIYAMPGTRVNRVAFALVGAVRP